MKDSVIVRPALESDAKRVSELMEQLGYKATEREIATRLREAMERRIVLVAVAGGVVGGWISISVDTPFIEGREVLIEGLVVDERLRSRRIGERLLREAEQWARTQGCANVRVQSNVVRDRAHAFYERNGYARYKTQHQFRKRL